MYYTSTQQRLFCEVEVNPTTLEAVGSSVNILAKGMQADDLLLDERPGMSPVAYIATHRDNTVLRIPLDRQTRERDVSELDVVAEGTKQDDAMLGPTAGVWARGMEGKRAFFTTDGGLKNTPDDGIVRCGKLVRLDF